MFDCMNEHELVFHQVVHCSLLSVSTGQKITEFNHKNHDSCRHLPAVYNVKMGRWRMPKLGYTHLNPVTHRPYMCLPKFIQRQAKFFHNYQCQTVMTSGGNLGGN